jgi:uncharacterized membrane protein
VRRRLPLALTLGALLWSGIVVGAPLALQQPALAGAATTVYAASARVCHQRPERSFRIAGRQLPVCARCLGVYLAGAAGALLGWTRVSRRQDRARLVLLVAAAPTALTWGAEVAGLAGFSNAARGLAAVPLGGAAGWLFVQMLRYDAARHGHQVDDRGSRVHSG